MSHPLSLLSALVLCAFRVLHPGHASNARSAADPAGWQHWKDGKPAGAKTLKPSELCYVILLTIAILSTIACCHPPHDGCQGHVISIAWENSFALANYSSFGKGRREPFLT